MNTNDLTKDLRVGEDGRELTKQEENWVLMTVLQMPWKDVNAIEDQNDREFLLSKALEVHTTLRLQHEAMNRMRQQKAEQEDNPASNLVYPNQ